MPTPFERFYEGEFQSRLLRRIDEPGLLSSDVDPQKMSWDRRAAYLLWVALGRPTAPTHLQTPAPPPPDEDDLDSLLG